MADVAKGIGAALQSVGESTANWQEQKIKLEQNQALLAQRKLEFEAERGKREKELEILNFGQAATVMQNYGTMAERYGEKIARAFLEKNRATVQNYFDVDSFAVDPKASAQMIRDHMRLMTKKSKGEQFSPDEIELLSTLERNLGADGKKISNELVASQYQAYLDKQIGPVGLGERKISPAAAGRLGELTKQAPEGTQYNVLPGGLALGQKKFAPDTTESGFRKSAGQKAGPRYDAAVEALPENEARLERIGAAFEIVDRVMTGQLAGRSIPFAMQKIASEDAQALEFLLASENVQLIMKFAKDAGVRAIDTEAERQNLLKSLANEKLDAPVFKKALTSMRAAIEAAKIQTLEQQAWIQAGHDDLIGFKSSLQGKKAYVDSNGNVSFFAKGEERPKGIKSLKEMWADKTMFQGKAVTSTTISDDDLTSLDEKYGKK